jgi:hypothetical protein
MAWCSIIQQKPGTSLPFPISEAQFFLEEKETSVSSGLVISNRCNYINNLEFCSMILTLHVKCTKHFKMGYIYTVG